MDKRIEEFQSKIDDIERKESDLRIQKRKIADEYIKAIEDICSPLVGRCYKYKDKDIYNYFMVLDVPREYWDKYREFSSYRFEVMNVSFDESDTNDEGAIEREFRYFYATDYNDPVEYMRASFQEISTKEFECALQRYYDNIKHICNLDSEEK